MTTTATYNPLERRAIVGKALTEILGVKRPLTLAEKESTRVLNRELDLIEIEIATDKRSRHEAEYRAAFHQYLRVGEKSLRPEHRKALEANGPIAETRDMQTGTGAYAGGNGPLVPVGFYPQVMAMMKAADDLFNPDVVGWLETDTGNPFSLPNMDDTSSSASIVAQGVQITTQDLATLGQLSFPEAPTWRSGMIKVSIELDTDAGFSLEDLFAQSFAVRFARGIGAYNVGKLLAAATLGATAVGASGNNGTSATGGTTVGSDDLYSLMGSVDPAYVASPKCAWVMNFQTMTAIAQLKDKNGRPLHLIKQNPATNEVELLMKPIRVCPSMANIGPNATPIAFGDLGRFIVRAVPSSMRVQRLGERFAEYLQVAYQAFLRADSNLQLTPGSQSPVKYLQNAAS